ncbi:hypothetical protein LX32DRAFT_188062 [Colletotrichum zoysiae]|uniref:Secreted protein n=1 Tax=Colletotrichum zoysiae TaxID=1216348 RepID=A0AAD9LY55_9PEZI|nr:hypothetical protein LX32DRAFT_188062 [Colletotrichum zoysiae]
MAAICNSNMLVFCFALTSSSARDVALGSLSFSSYIWSFIRSCKMPSTLHRQAGETRILQPAGLPGATNSRAKAAALVASIHSLPVIQSTSLIDQLGKLHPRKPLAEDEFRRRMRVPMIRVALLNFTAHRGPSPHLPPSTVCTVCQALPLVLVAGRGSPFARRH